MTATPPLNDQPNRQSARDVAVQDWLRRGHRQARLLAITIKAHGYWLGLAILMAYWVLTPVPGESDAHNYYALDLADPYRNRWADYESFVYSPAFGQLIYPATLLPVEAFYKMFQAINLACLAWLLGPLGAAIALLVPFTRSELSAGQIHLWLAVMCVLGVRHPSVWAFGLLTKVTPGVGLLYFAARREWKAMGVAMLSTTAIIAVSALLVPRAWFEWIDLLAESSTRTVENLALSEWPAAFRLPIAAGLTVMAGWRHRPAALPVIVCFALPAIWPGALTMLAAIPRLRRNR